MLQVISGGGDASEEFAGVPSATASWHSDLSYGGNEAPLIHLGAFGKNQRQPPFPDSRPSLLDRGLVHVGRGGWEGLIQLVATL